MKKYILLLIIGWSFGAAAQFTLTTDSIHREEFDRGQGSSSPITVVPDNNPKIVYWIHGLSGNSQSWSRVQEVTDGDDTVPGYPVRRSFGYVVDYSGQENRSMNGLAGWVHGEVENWRSVPARTDTLNRHSDIIVAHSQGGIATRTMRKRHLQDSSRFPLPIRNIATFGTPHGGAVIINNTRPVNGNVQKWINVGCDRLASAEIQTFVGSIWWLGTFVSPTAVSNFANVACSGLNRTALPILIESLRKPSAADYAIGSNHLSALTHLAQRDSNINMVSFYAVESEPVLWRSLGSMTFTKDTSIAGSILSTNPFGLNDDYHLPHFINSKIQDYRSKEDEYTTFTAWEFVKDMNNYWDADEKALTYRAAKTWLMTSNLSWKRFIGARFDSVYQDGYLCTCGPGGQSFRVNTPADCISTCPSPPPVGAGRFPWFQDLTNYYVGILPNLVQHVTEIPNDGLVTVPTQVDYPGAVLYPMEDTNHMQMRNCLETKDALDDLFDGKLGGRFKIPEQ